MSEPTQREPWLPPGFTHPGHVELMPDVHLRPIRGQDVDIDYPAVMGSRERLWAKYGEAWGWPPASMTEEQFHDWVGSWSVDISRQVEVGGAL